jgi:hypothetical protein
MLRKLNLIPDVIRAFGWLGIFRRIKYMALTKIRWYKLKSPIKTAISRDQDFGFTFSFELDKIRDAYKDLPNLKELKSLTKEQVEHLLQGKLSYFSSQDILIGWPPRWLENPVTNQVYDQTKHWSEIKDLDPLKGDIKYTWEASRFGFTYLLCRAFVQTNNDRYVKEFWIALENWLSQNPINGGPNWRCGQEVALRMMGVLFGLLTFGGHEATKRSDLELVGMFLRESGNRIFLTLDYALSQRNNHALSEIVGLWTLSTLFPKWKESSIWKKVAEVRLAEVLNDQFYSDGGYVQHSFNYQRLAIHNLMWLVRIANVASVPPPIGVVSALQSSVKFLYSIQDEKTGWLPNYGANDGALIIPLSTLEFRDFRPTLQAAWYLTNQEPLYQETTINEESVWFAPTMFKNPKIDPTTRNSLMARESGYFTARGNSSFAFWRAVSYSRHRPSQADNLHIDVWIDGINLALDPGTYTYNQPPPWDNGLGKTHVHNTANINNNDQMVRVGRFLWAAWSKIKILDYQSDVDSELWLFESTPMPEADGFSQHRRAILRSRDRYIVADLIQVTHRKKLGIHWNIIARDWKHDVSRNSLQLLDQNFVIMVRSDNNVEFQVTRGTNKDDIQGWESPLYGKLQPCVSIDASIKTQKVKYVSSFARNTDQVTRYLEDELLQYVEELSKDRLKEMAEKIFKQGVKSHDLLG